MRRATLVVAVLIAACNPPIDEVAAEPLFEPPPDATVIATDQRVGAAFSGYGTSVSMVFASPHGIDDVTAWYSDLLAEGYILESPFDPFVDDSGVVDFMGRSLVSDALVGVEIFPDRELFDEFGVAEAGVEYEEPPPATATYIYVRAEKS